MVLILSSNTWSCSRMRRRQIGSGMKSDLLPMNWPTLRLQHTTTQRLAVVKHSLLATCALEASQVDAYAVQSVSRPACSTESSKPAHLQLMTSCTASTHHGGAATARAVSAPPSCLKRAGPAL